MSGVQRIGAFGQTDSTAMALENGRGRWMVGSPGLRSPQVCHRIRRDVGGRRRRLPSCHGNVGRYRSLPPSARQLPSHTLPFVFRGTGLDHYLARLPRLGR
jgi:hypothetical protein